MITCVLVLVLVCAVLSFGFPVSVSAQLPGIVYVMCRMWRLKTITEFCVCVK